MCFFVPGKEKYNYTDKMVLLLQTWTRTLFFSVIKRFVWIVESREPHACLNSEQQ